MNVDAFNVFDIDNISANRHSEFITKIAGSNVKSISHCIGFEIQDDWQRCTIGDIDIENILRATTPRSGADISATVNVANAFSHDEVITKSATGYRYIFITVAVAKLDPETFPVFRHLIFGWLTDILCSIKDTWAVAQNHPSVMPQAAQANTPCRLLRVSRINFDFGN